jgi:ubiquinone/menaquinone biosynthesis C-methylase UbiE
MTPQTVTAKFIPALRFPWLTRFYDRLVPALGEATFKKRLVRDLQLQPGHRVLDLGCGTGTLAIRIKKVQPEASVVGLDADPEILALARRKVQESGVSVDLQHGLAHQAPFAPASFDRIVSSLVFHHLTTEEKRSALAGAKELLGPGGEIHIADWGKAQNPLMRVAYLTVQLLDGFETTGDNVAGRLPTLLEEAGFRDVRETHRQMTVLGTLSFYRGVRP